jgi:hypothetical protein
MVNTDSLILPEDITQTIRSNCSGSVNRPGVDLPVLRSRRALSKSDSQHQANEAPAAIDYQPAVLKLNNDKGCICESSTLSISRINQFPYVHNLISEYRMLGASVNFFSLVGIT